MITRQERLRNGLKNKPLTASPSPAILLFMPQLHAGEKALRTSARKRAVNDVWRKKIRFANKAIREALAANDKTAALAKLQETESVLDRAARRNIIHPNKAARKKSRLRKMIAAA